MMIRYLCQVLLICFVLGVSAPLCSASDVSHQTVEGVPYALIGVAPAQPAPTLVLLAADRETTLTDPNFCRGARKLRDEAGFLVVGIDMPAHGDDVRPGEKSGLPGWAQRIGRQEDVVAPFVQRVKTVIDHLIRTGRSDPGRIALFGISRGGFMSLQVMAADPRIAAAITLSPVTDLAALSEFTGMESNHLVRSTALVLLAPALAGRPVWISIGNRDRRVDTDRCIAFTRAVVAATPADMKLVPLNLLVLPTDNHRQTEQAHEQAAAWLVARFSRR